MKPSELRKFRKEIRGLVEANAALDIEQGKEIRALKGRVTKLEKAMKSELAATAKAEKAEAKKAAKEKAEAEEEAKEDGDD